MPSCNIHKRAPHLFTLADLKAWQPPKLSELIHGGVLDAEGKMVIFGEAGSWKTMLLQHLGFSVANGLYWLGFPTTKAAIYRLQTELPMSRDYKRQIKFIEAIRDKYIIDRVPPTGLTEEAMAKLIEEAHAFACPEWLILRTESFIKLDTSYGMADMEKDLHLLREELPKGYPLIISIDPFFTVVTGKLNAQEDQQRFLDNMAILCKRYSAAIIIVHHPRKSAHGQEGQKFDFGAEDAAGNAVLRNWCDTMLRVDLLNPQPQGSSDRVKLQFVKHRNADEPLPVMELRWNRKTLWPDVLKRWVPKDDEEPELRGLE